MVGDAGKPTYYTGVGLSKLSRSGKKGAKTARSRPDFDVGSSGGGFK